MQLEDASEIVQLYNLANGSLLHLESSMEELQTYICVTEMNENEIEQKLEELNNEYFHYEKNLRDVRPKKLILSRCKKLLAKSQNHSFDGKASLPEVDKTLINGCHRSSETPSKLAKNPEEKSIGIKNIRNLNLPW